MKNSILIVLSALAFCSAAPNAFAAPVQLAGTPGGGAMATAPGERSGTIYGVAFSPDSKTLASGDDLGEIALWNTENNQRRATFKGHESFVDALTWSPDGEQLLSVGVLIKNGGALQGSELKIWDVAAGKPRFELDWTDFYAQLAAWSPDGKVIAVAGSKSRADKLFPIVELRDAATGQLLRTLTPDSGNKTLNRLQFSPDSQLLLTLLHWEGTGDLWDVASGESVRALKPAPELKIPFASDVFAFSPDSQSLARGRFNGSLILESTRDGRLLQTLNAPANFPIEQVKFSPDGSVLSSMDSFNLQRWNVAAAQMIEQVRIGTSGDATLSDNGLLVASHGNRELFLERLEQN